MTTATELWPPGSKYDVEAIRRRIKSCNSWTFDWDDWIDYGTKESADFFDVCRQRHPIWESVGEIKRNLADPVALDDARRLLLAFLDELLAASVSESELKIDLNADWEDWNVPPRRFGHPVPPHPRVCLKGIAGQRPSIEVEFLHRNQAASVCCYKQQAAKYGFDLI